MNKQLGRWILLGLAPLFAAAAPLPQVKTEPKAAGKETSFAHLKAPLFAEHSRSIPVARVESEIITLGELVDSLGAGHAESATGAKAGPKDFKGFLDRLIDTRLVVIEARAMGLDELPEVTKAVEDFRKVALSEILREQVTKDVVADPAAVEARYQAAVKQWKVRSILFSKEEDARAASTQLKAGKSYDEVAKAALAEKKAQGNEAADYLGAEAYRPEVLAAFTPLYVGESSAPLKVGEGFVILHLDDIRFPHDPQVKMAVEFEALERAQNEALAKYIQELTKKYATINQRLLDKLDMDASPARFNAALKDRRAIAKIKGEPPITVAEVADEVQKKFFHGSNVAVRDKRANEQIPGVFDRILRRRLILREAVEQKLSETDEYKRRVADYESSALFSTFVNRAVTPEIRVTEEENKKYYDEHQGDFSSPEFIKLLSLGFKSLKDAESAVAKLKAGTDFKWLKTNASGQVEEGKRWVDFDGNTLSVRVLEPEVGKAIAGARAGDYRIASPPQRGSYVLYVKERIAPRAQPFEATRDVIAKKLYGQKVEAAIKGWIAKLRKAQRIEIYLTQIGS